ncbi:DUF3429 domain-containing protein [Sphingomonas sp. 2R-10]|uniref:DUF3429 domain-containing protein n=1 Tax=Sphingomonas sp. 2R-10 TaxID=3045148 RepID=UPI0019D2D813|nr:DUF3429 domain-containing protein [Sphingomonas sp. 2R-10]MDJ0278234.1 DUF3429 domain-containing protein [Sphingomonas sp. 2R-10]
MTDPVAMPVATVRPPVAALLLGYAGLLPPMVAIAIRVVDPSKGGMMLALSLFYAALILSFLGGMWWGAAASRVTGAALTLWLAVAVVPTLVALAAGAVLFASVVSAAAVVAAGLLGSLLVDMALVRAGHVPAWWMKLRVPLSVGLAALTLLAGLLAQR